MPSRRPLVQLYQPTGYTSNSVTTERIATKMLSTRAHQAVSPLHAGPAAPQPVETLSPDVWCVDLGESITSTESLKRCSLTCFGRPHRLLETQVAILRRCSRPTQETASCQHAPATSPERKSGSQDRPIGVIKVSAREGRLSPLILFSPSDIGLTDLSLERELPR